MTPQLAIALASLIGALLFFAAGFFIARERGRAGAAAGQSGAAGGGARDPAQQPRERQPERALLARTTADFRRVEAGRDAANRTVAELQEKLERLRRSTAGKGTDQQTLRTQVAQLQLALEGADAAKGQLIAEIGRLRSELEARATRRAGTGSAVPVLPVGDLERDGASLEHYLERLCERGGARGAVLADSAGLVIASAGLGGEELAALAAPSVNYGASASDLVSLGPLHQLTLSDGTDLTFSAFPFRVASTTLILATLSTGPMARETMEPVLHRASELLG